MVWRRISLIESIQILDIKCSIPVVQNMKSILCEPLWFVGGSPSIPYFWWGGSTRFVNSTSLAVPLLHGMKSSVVSMQTMISWEQAVNDWIKVIKSCIGFSLMLSCFCCRSSKISHCCEWAVDTPWLSFGT